MSNAEKPITARENSAKGEALDMLDRLHVHPLSRFRVQLSNTVENLPKKPVTMREMVLDTECPTVSNCPTLLRRDRNEW